MRSLHDAQVEQWTESRYPSYIQIGQPAPKTSDEWREGMDARIKQLPGLEPEEMARRDRALRTQGQKMSYEDVSADVRSQGRVKR